MRTIKAVMMPQIFKKKKKKKKKNIAGNGSQLTQQSIRPLQGNGMAAISKSRL